MIRERFFLVKGMLDDLIDILSKISNGEDMKKLVSLFESDILIKFNFLKEFVEVKIEKLYLIENYGFVMILFYSVFFIWVGILFILVLLFIFVYGNYKFYEIYFGRGFIFLSIVFV